MPVQPTRNDTAATSPSECRPGRYSEHEIARARSASTPDALTIIDPFAAPVRLRRLSDGMDVL